MNARQKAKRYKRMYEELVNKPVKITVEQHKIDRLRFKRVYPRYLVIDENSSYFKEVILKDIAFDLVKSLDKYIDYHTEFYLDTNEYCFVGEIKVVEKEVKECRKEQKNLV
jgi:hypothetical protein